MAGDSYSSVIVTFKANGTQGTDNFVTSTTVANGEVILQTLLIPAYYDSLDGGADGSLEVSGTVLLEYIEPNARRLGLVHLAEEHERNLQIGDEGKDEDKTPFSITIPLEKPGNNVPKVGQGETERSHADNGTFFGFVSATMMTCIVAAFYIWY
mmetsp:Transcript_13269/g.27849  ORF Transcript_13269/g.27849 Transcript_13269/m.27849 type:complete len:154 (-) Transcript_13269:182-643(-)